MVSDQRWNIVWQWCPEELEDDRHLLRFIGGVTLFMSPGSRRIALITEMVEVAMMDLVTPKIRHISLLLTEERIDNEI
jgi:hypothetical protein